MGHILDSLKAKNISKQSKIMVCSQNQKQSNQTVRWYAIKQFIDRNSHRWYYKKNQQQQTLQQPLNKELEPPQQPKLP